MDTMADSSGNEGWSTDPLGTPESSVNVNKTFYIGTGSNLKPIEREWGVAGSEEMKMSARKCSRSRG